MKHRIHGGLQGRLEPELLEFDPRRCKTQRIVGAASVEIRESR